MGGAQPQLSSLPSPPTYCPNPSSGGARPDLTAARLSRPRGTGRLQRGRTLSSLPARTPASRTPRGGGQPLTWQSGHSHHGRGALVCAYDRHKPPRAVATREWGKRACPRLKEPLCEGQVVVVCAETLPQTIGSGRTEWGWGVHRSRSVRVAPTCPPGKQPAPLSHPNPHPNPTPAPRSPHPARFHPTAGLPPFRHILADFLRAPLCSHSGSLEDMWWADSHGPTPKQPKPIRPISWLGKPRPWWESGAGPGWVGFETSSPHASLSMPPSQRVTSVEGQGHSKDPSRVGPQPSIASCNSLVTQVLMNHCQP